MKAADREKWQDAACFISQTETGGPLPGKTVLIGVNGRMGRMLLEEAKKNGLYCVGLDRPYHPKSCKDLFRDADVAFLCVPAAVLADVIAGLKPYFPEGMILADITSVKELPMRIMERMWNGPVTGTHPLFGPNSDFERDLPVAIVPGKGGDCATQKVENFFRKLHCRVFRCSAQTHDRAMAKIQNMNFITNLAYFALLAGEKDLLPFLTPSFLRRKDAAAKMLTEDAAMFAGLYEANPHSHEAVRQFGKMLSVAAAGDINLLCNRARWWWKKPGRDERDKKPD